MRRKTWPRSSVEFGFVFGFPDMLSGVVLDAFQFGGIDEFGLGGAEMESSPFVLQRVEAVAMAFPKPVAALGCAEEAGAAAGSGEHGSDDIVPNMGGHPGGFVEDGEIEAVAAQFIGLWALRMAIIPPFCRSMRRSVWLMATSFRCLTLFTRSRQIWLAIW